MGTITWIYEYYIINFNFIKLIKKKYIYTLQQNFNYAILMELFYFMLIVQIQLKVILLQLESKSKGRMYN